MLKRRAPLFVEPRPSQSSSPLQPLSATADPEPLIVPRAEHSVSRSNISPNALKVLYRLRDAGHAAYLVGGGVRDLLLGHEPKDFDVATDATPEEVRQVFRNCRLIGRRFRLAHVFFGPEIIEVATFRASAVPAGQDGSDDDTLRTENGMILRDNVYGTIAEDALRRDFTVNALYYNIDDFSLVDYAGGLADLKAGRLRLIGDDIEARYREDPVRMLRAVRFACKLGFMIDADCETPLAGLAPLLAEVPPARLFEEILKLFQAGYGLHAFEKLRHYGLFAQLFPATEACLARQEHEFPVVFVSRGLDRTDRRVLDGKSVVPFVLFAVLLWEPVRLRYQELLDGGAVWADAMALASHEVATAQQRHVAIPKRFGLPMREVWALQPRLEQRQGRRPMALLGHPRFRAAYDFLLLRAEAGEVDPELADWWTKFQDANPNERAKMMGTGTKKRPRRRRKPKSAGGGGDGAMGEPVAGLQGQAGGDGGGD